MTMLAGLGRHLMTGLLPSKVAAVAQPTTEMCKESNKGDLVVHRSHGVVVVLSEGNFLKYIDDFITDYKADYGCAAIRVSKTKFNSKIYNAKTGRINDINLRRRKEVDG